MRILLATVAALLFPLAVLAQPLPGTKLLEGKDDFARVMVDGIHRYLDKHTEQIGRASCRERV